MSVPIVAMTEAELATVTTDEQAGLGALVTARGNLALETLDVEARIIGLVGQITLTQGYRNPHDLALEATYVFPLPDRAAVTAMRMTAAGRTVQAQLKVLGNEPVDFLR